MVVGQELILCSQKNEGVHVKIIDIEDNGKVIWVQYRDEPNRYESYNLSDLENILVKQ
jgi:hypothetical protein